MPMAFFQSLGFGGPAMPAKEAPPASAKPEPVRALPANWYTSQQMYELERRAIFSRKWQIITHQMRIAQPGDWLKFEIAGYEFIVSRDRKGKINAFHNVCRHRAFPVVQGQSGNAKIFACKYHGWSYGLDGKLAKAPKYDEYPEFDKSKNGMLPIHVHIDVNGFLWVNLDASPNPEPWEEDFANVDTQERYKQFNFDDYFLSHEYTMSGAYNWKILADNFNECYHCPTTHPDVPTLADIETHDVDTGFGWIKHQSKLTEEQKRDGLGIASTYYFPNASTSVLPHYIMFQRFLPTGPQSSTMHYQIFRNKNSTDEQFHLISDLYARVVSEDKDLCEQAQRNLNAGIFINGELHSRLEKGPLFFQKKNREEIWKHVEKERAARREIWPARQNLPSKAGISSADVELCEGLACGQRNQEVLAW